jgi:hypothetical protein
MAYIYYIGMGETTWFTVGMCSGKTIFCSPVSGYVCLALASIEQEKYAKRKISLGKKTTVKCSNF